MAVKHGLKVMQRRDKIMKLSEIDRSRKTVFSLEVFPPKKSSPLESITNILGEMRPFEPDFISVTFGAGGSLADNYTCKISPFLRQPQPQRGARCFKAAGGGRC